MKLFNREGSTGLFYALSFIFGIGYLIFSIGYIIFSSPPTRSFCAEMIVYNSDSTKSDTGYSQVLVKGDKKLVGFVSLSGKLYGQDDFTESYDVYMISFNHIKESMTEVILKNGERYAIALIGSGECTPERIKNAEIISNY